MTKQPLIYGSLALALVFFGLLAGCVDTNGPTTKPSNMHDRQAQALNDPFGVKAETDPVDISGGAINEYDHNAMKRDLDSVFNP
ncbi:MAG TPA: hypothetical protein VL282_00975 [Tepidisphaeraceae bacterium]|jgi:hypothetical protein|nr:hypothetical protein [Tepidisphaeraceae bacterium]